MSPPLILVMEDMLEKFEDDFCIFSPISFLTLALTQFFFLTVSLLGVAKRVNLTLFGLSWPTKNGLGQASPPLENGLDTGMSEKSVLADKTHNE